MTEQPLSWEIEYIVWRYLWSRVSLAHLLLNKFWFFQSTQQTNTLKMPMVLVFVLKWVKIKLSMYSISLPLRGSAFLRKEVLSQQVTVAPFREWLLLPQRFTVQIKSFYRITTNQHLQNLYFLFISILRIRLVLVLFWQLVVPPSTTIL